MVSTTYFMEKDDLASLSAPPMNVPQMPREQSLEPSIEKETHFPEGGYQAWGVCAASVLLYFVSFGFQNAFGVFQTYYTTELPGGPLSSPSDISWIGSFQVSSKQYHRRF